MFQVVIIGYIHLWGQTKECKKERGRRRGEGGEGEGGEGEGGEGKGGEGEGGEGEGGEGKEERGKEEEGGREKERNNEERRILRCSEERLQINKNQIHFFPFTRILSPPI